MNISSSLRYAVTESSKKHG